jgi:3-hydroxyisobutyrate dehydrogenase-like beta-hydroxyacid dehydrogenase
MKVGFIGTGTMGIGMALNLREAGVDLIVHDLNPASAEPAIAADTAKIVHNLIALVMRMTIAEIKASKEAVQAMLARG